MPGIILLLQIGFLLILIIRMAGFIGRTIVLIRRKMMTDVQLFLREYWQWRFVKDHMAGFALGLSSLASFIAIEIISHNVRDVPLDKAFASSPIMTGGVVVGLLGVLAYAAKKTWEQHATVYAMCDHLDRLRWFRLYKNSIAAVQSVPWMQKGAGLFANLGLSVVSSASQSVVDGIVEHGIKKEIAETAALIAVEYAVRIALVAGGLILTKIQA